MLDTVLQKEYFAGYCPGDSILQSLDTVQQREYFAGHCPAENILLDTVLGIVFCWTCMHCPAERILIFVGHRPGDSIMLDTVQQLENILLDTCSIGMLARIYSSIIIILSKSVRMYLFHAIYNHHASGITLVAYQ